MLPHPETVRKIDALHYQERLQYVATERLAASVHAAGRIRSLMGWKARLVITTWVPRVRTRVHFARRRTEALPEASSPT
jgi:hypothetical protein